MFDVQSGGCRIAPCCTLGGGNNWGAAYRGQEGTHFTKVEGFSTGPTGQQQCEDECAALDTAADPGRACYAYQWRNNNAECKIYSVTPMYITTGDTTQWPFTGQGGGYCGFLSYPTGRMLMISFVSSGTVESFDATAFGASLATELNVTASDVTVTVEPASIRVSVTISVDVDQSEALVTEVNTLFADPQRTQSALGVTVESFTAPTIAYFSPPPSTPPSPPAPPAPPPAAHVCAADGSDDACSPFAGATWSSMVSSYHFYLYDETPDGTDLKLWEWPRVTPADAQLANNNICEDGLPAFNASIPQGDYYVAFGSPDCAVHYVNLSTGLISGCGRVALVPCLLGTDCADCGRSASQIAEESDGRRRRAQALPAMDDVHEMRHLERTLRTASSYHLPKPWLDALQIAEHIDPSHPPTSESATRR